MKQEQKEVETREAIERLKDIASKDIQGSVKDWHIADLLNIPYSSFRNSLTKNRLPLKPITRYCYKNNIDLFKIIY